MPYLPGKSIRHPKKDIRNITDQDKISLKIFLDEIKLDQKQYCKILKTLLLNEYAEKPKVHTSKILEKQDYEYLKTIAYTLASLGFPFLTIQNLFLELISARRISKWAKEHSSNKHRNTFLQSPIYVYIADNFSSLQAARDNYKKAIDNDAGVDEELEKLLNLVMSQEIAILNEDGDKVLTIEELLELEKKDLRK